MTAAKSAGKDAAEAARAEDPVASERALRSYLGARLNRSADAFSPDDGRTAVAAAGLNEALAGELGDLLERCEAVRYGGASTAGLAESLADWLLRADKEWA